MHHLEPEDLAAHKATCAYLLELVANVNRMENVLFSHEATFHTCGSINRNYCRIWTDQQPN